MHNRILAFMEDMASNDALKVSDWFTNDSQVWIPPCKPVIGITRIRALFRALFSRYKYIEWIILDILPVSPDRCIHICESNAEFKTGVRYRNQVITDIVFNGDGKIISLSDYFKDTTVLASVS